MGKRFIQVSVENWIKVSIFSLGGDSQAELKSVKL